MSKHWPYRSAEARRAALERRWKRDRKTPEQRASEFVRKRRWPDAFRTCYQHSEPTHGCWLCFDALLIQVDELLSEAKQP